VADTEWRGEFTSDEVEALHLEAFGVAGPTTDWRGVVEAHSLGWVTARDAVGEAGRGAAAAGAEWLHVDFEPELEDFYLRACGFSPTSAGLLRLSPG